MMTMMMMMMMMIIIIIIGGLAGWQLAYFQGLFTY
jgi:hypothetical protein